MSQKTINLCLERYNFVKFGETTKSTHTVLCTNNAHSVNSDKYRLTPTAIASKHGEGYVFTLNYDFDRPLFTIVQKSYSIDGTSGKILFEGIDPISKDGSKYLRRVEVSPVKLSDSSYLLEVTKDEYLRIGTTGAALGDEGLESLNEKIVTMGGIEKSVETVGGKQVLKLDGSGTSGKEIIYFDVVQSDIQTGLYDAIGEALSGNKLPAIRSDGKLYLYTSTGTDRYDFVGVFSTDNVEYKVLTVFKNDAIVKKTVDVLEGKYLPLYYHQNDDGFTVADKTGHALTKTEIADAYRAGQIFMFSSYPASNTQAHWGYCCDINIDSDNTGYAEFFILAAFGGDSYAWEKYRINLSSNTEFVTLWGPNTSYSTGYSGSFAEASDVAVLQSQVASLSNGTALKSSMITPSSDWLTFDGTNGLNFGAVFSRESTEVVGNKIRMQIPSGQTKYRVEGAKHGVFSIVGYYRVKWQGTPVNKIGSISGYELDFSRNFTAIIGTMPAMVVITPSSQDFYGLTIPLPASQIDAPAGVQIAVVLQITYLGDVED